MRRELRDTGDGAVFDVPPSNEMIAATGDDGPAVRSNTHRDDAALEGDVALVGGVNGGNDDVSDRIRSLQIPRPDRGVVAGCEQLALTGHEGNRPNLAGVPSESGRLTEGRAVPHDDEAVIRPCNQPPPLVVDGERANLAISFLDVALGVRRTRGTSSVAVTPGFVGSLTSMTAMEPPHVPTNSSSPSKSAVATGLSPSRGTRSVVSGDLEVSIRSTQPSDASTPDDVLMALPPPTAIVDEFSSAAIVNTP